MKAYKKNNTTGLQSVIADKLSKSEMWLVLRMDHEGVHLHMPNDEHLALFALFFTGQPEIFEAVAKFVRSKKP